MLLVERTRRRRSTLIQRAMTKRRPRPASPGALHSLRHTGASSCFSGALPAAGGFAALDGIIAERARAMADSGPLVVHHAELHAATARRPQPSAQEAWRGSDRAHRRVCR